MARYKEVRRIESKYVKGIITTTSNRYNELLLAINLFEFYGKNLPKDILKQVENNVNFIYLTKVFLRDRKRITKTTIPDTIKAMRAWSDNEITEVNVILELIEDTDDSIILKPATSHTSRLMELIRDYYFVMLSLTATLYEIIYALVGNDTLIKPYKIPILNGLKLRGYSITMILIKNLKEGTKITTLGSLPNTMHGMVQYIIKYEELDLLLSEYYNKISTYYKNAIMHKTTKEMRYQLALDTQRTEILTTTRTLKHLLK